MAGMAGFEPTHARVKVWCLYQLGYIPVSSRGLRETKPEREIPVPASLHGVDDGARTHDLQSHNLAL